MLVQIYFKIQIIITNTLKLIHHTVTKKTGKNNFPSFLVCPFR
uniref:Uncharacterized protein n=1 Tax=Anguilla anguilla TaxID=7936 RepID=A0A0E9XLE3_ANGAN